MTTTDNSKRTPCEVRTRVMGYLRPVSHYNTGKKSEFYSRKYFTLDKINNSEFIKKFLPSKNNNNGLWEV